MDTLRGIFCRISWLKIAFVYGDNAHSNKNHDTKRADEEKKEAEEENIEEGEERTSGLTVNQISFNGLISSVQIFMVIMAVTVSVALSTQSSDEWSRRRENWNMTILVVLMVAGTGVMTTIWKYRGQAVAFGKCAIGSDDVRGTEGRRGATKSRVTVIGLLVFYVCGSLLDLLNVIAQSNCTSIQRTQCVTFK